MWLQAEASRRGYAHTQGEQVRVCACAPRQAGLGWAGWLGMREAAVSPRAA